MWPLLRFNPKAWVIPAVALAAAVGTAAPADEAGDDRVTVEGRVLDPDGQPTQGAKLYLVPNAGRGAHLTVRAVTDAEGRFRFSFSKAATPGPGWTDQPWRKAAIFATAEGSGPDWIRVEELEPGQPATLRLARDDVPIEGMIADLEGRPLAGVTVRPQALRASPDGRLDTFLEAFRDDPFMVFQTLHNEGRLKAIWSSLPGWPAEVKTDEQGRFRLTGVGRERVVSLEVEGPTIEQMTIHVLTRPDVDAKKARRSSPQFQMMMEAGAHLPVLYGSRFHHLAGPTRPIVGTVRERGTGKPIAGATIFGQVRNRETHAYALSDAEGRYRLVGLPTEGEASLTAHPAKGQSYLMASARRTIDGAGGEPVAFDFELARGVLLRGRLVDAATGRPVQGTVTYLAFSDNPHLRDVPAVPLAGTGIETDADGSFEVVGLPGPGALAGRAGEDRFCMSRPQQWDYPADERGLYATANMGLVTCDNFHGVVKVNPGPDTEEVRRDIALDPGLAVRGTLVDPEGQPVEGATASKLTALGFSDRLPGAEFTATGLEPDRPRPVWFLNARRTLGRMIMLPGEHTGPITVTLQPTGILTGRIVDAEGRPKPDAQVFCSVQLKPIGWMHQQVKADGDGRFRVTGVLPGLTYSVGASDRSEPIEGLTVRTGEAKDLGDIRLGRESVR